MVWWGGVGGWTSAGLLSVTNLVARVCLMQFNPKRAHRALRQFTALAAQGKAVLADPNSAVTREAISCFHRRKGRGIMKSWKQEEGEELEREEEFCVGSTKVLAATTTTGLPWSIDWRDLLAVPTSSR